MFRRADIPTTWRQPTPMVSMNSLKKRKVVEREKKQITKIKKIPGAVF